MVNLPNGLFDKRDDNGYRADSTNFEHFDVELLGSCFRCGIMVYDGRASLSRAGFKSPEDLMRRFRRRVDAISHCTTVIIMLQRDAVFKAVPEYDHKQYFGLIIDTADAKNVQLFGTVPPDLMETFSKEVFPALHAWAAEHIDEIRARAQEGAKAFCLEVAADLKHRYGELEEALLSLRSIELSG